MWGQMCKHARVNMCMCAYVQENLHGCVQGEAGHARRCVCVRRRCTRGIESQVSVCECATGSPVCAPGSCARVRAGAGGASHTHAGSRGEHGVYHACSRTPDTHGEQPHACARRRVRVRPPVHVWAPSPERRRGRVRRAGGGRTLGQAGVAGRPVPVPVPTEATQAPWSRRPPPCSGSGGGRAREPPWRTSRLSWWGTGAAGRRRCWWPLPEGTSPRYCPPCPLRAQPRWDPVAVGGLSGAAARRGRDGHSGGSGAIGSRSWGRGELGQGVAKPGADGGPGQPPRWAVGHLCLSWGVKCGRVCPAARAHRGPGGCREGGPDRDPRTPVPAPPGRTGASCLPEARCCPGLGGTVPGLWGTRSIPTPPAPGGTTISCHPTTPFPFPNPGYLPVPCPGHTELRGGPPHHCPRAGGTYPMSPSCPLPGVRPHRVREVHGLPPGWRQTCEDPPLGHSRWDSRGQGRQSCPPPSSLGVSGCPTPVGHTFGGCPHGRPWEIKG